MVITPREQTQKPPTRRVRGGFCVCSRYPAITLLF